MAKQVLNLGNVPIIGQKEDKDRLIAQLEELVDLLRNKVAVQGQALRQADAMLQARANDIAYLLAKFTENKRIRITKDEYERFLNECGYEFYASFDKETNSIILALREPRHQQNSNKKNDKRQQKKK